MPRHTHQYTIADDEAVEVLTRQAAHFWLSSTASGETTQSA
jgi:hypothetical protein